MSFSTQTPLTAFLIQQFPLYVAWLTGIVLSLVKWQKHPRLSLLILLTLAGFLVLFVLDGLFALEAPQLQFNMQWSISQFITVYRGIDFVYSLLTALLWGFLFWALFGWRNATRVQAPDRQASAYPNPYAPSSQVASPPPPPPNS